MGKPSLSIYAEIPPWSSRDRNDEFLDSYPWKPLGPVEEIRDIITSAFPNISWSGEWGEVEWKGELGGKMVEGCTTFTLYYDVDDRLCRSIHVALFDEHSDQFDRMCDQHGWFQYSHEVGIFVNDPNKSRSDLDWLIEMISFAHPKRESLFSKIADLFGFRSK